LQFTSFFREKEGTWGMARTPRADHPPVIAALKRIKSDFDAQPEQFVTMKLPGDPDALRGLPMVGRNGRGGHIRGTRPDLLDLD
jgi:hypothetical protein